MVGLEVCINQTRILNLCRYSDSLSRQDYFYGKKNKVEHHIVTEILIQANLEFSRCSGQDRIPGVELDYCCLSRHNHALFLYRNWMCFSLTWLLTSPQPCDSLVLAKSSFFLSWDRCLLWLCWKSAGKVANHDLTNVGHNCCVSKLPTTQDCHHVVVELLGQL